jgi:hypothetical protein
MDPALFIMLGITVTLLILVFLYMLYIIGNTLVIKWKEEPHGVAPVQAQGHFLGYYFYFRSRYEKAKIEFARSQHDWDIDHITKAYLLYKTNIAYKASSMSYWKAKRLIYKGCFLFLLNRIKKKIMYHKKHKNA